LGSAAGVGDVGDGSERVPDKRIKSQFDSLKTRLEKKFPVECVVIDKRRNKPAQDIWADIQDELYDCGAFFFDVTAFRPNVVLELGYALAAQDESDIYITWRKRRTGGRSPAWLLSDISHLQRFEYTTVRDLDQFVEDQLLQTPWLKRLAKFNRLCREQTTAVDKYKAEGVRVLQELRDEGRQTPLQIQRLVQGSAVRRETLTNMLKEARLVKRTQGRGSRFYLPDE
jgi:hypothetical protein